MQPRHQVPSAHRAALLVAVLLCAVLPSDATAQGCTGSPGASALQQYCESVPRADGGRDRPGDASGSASRTTGSVSSRTASELRASGADGAAVEALAGAERPRDDSTSRGTATSPRSTSKAPGGSATPSGEPRPLEASTTAVAGGSTLGGWLVWLLVGTTVVGVGVAGLARRRSSHGA